MRKVRAAMLLAVMLLVVLLAGCGKSDTPRQYFSYDMPGRAASLDPQFIGDEAGRIVIQNCFEGLLSFNSDGELVNGVAEQLSISDDGRVYTFVISPQAKWSDGSDVTADDFMFAFERIFSPETPSPYAGDFLGIQNARAVLAGELPLSSLGVRIDAWKRIVFTLDEPDELFLTLLAGEAAMPCKRDFFASQRGSYGLSVGALLTNGPFVPTRWDQSRVVLAPSQSYRNPTTAQGVTIYLGVPDRETRFAAGRTDFLLTSGDINLGEEYHVKSFYDKTGLLVFNQSELPYGNMDVRAAFISAIDLDAVASLLERDGWRHPADGILPPVTALSERNYRSAAGSPALPALPRDARELLFLAYDEMDITSLPQTDMLLAQGVDMLIGSSLQRSWQQKLSAYINLLPIPAEELSRRVLAGDFKMAVLPISGGAGSPYGILNALGGRGADNIVRGQIEGLDEQIESATRALALSRAAQEFLLAEEIILASFSVWPIYYTSSCFASSPETTGAYYLAQNGMVYFKDAVRF